MFTQLVNNLGGIYEDFGVNGNILMEVVVYLEALLQMQY